jgi:exopolysaccharide production protein ExoY
MQGASGDCVVNKLVAKRAFDVICAIIALMITSPLILMVAIGIKLTSRGPVLFIQDRVGQDEKLFRFFKFRTMHSEVFPQMAHKAEELAAKGILLKFDGDPRITTFGRFLRKYSLDELPQLVNVLRGEMSLVGPRPLIPFMLAHDQDLRRQRCSVRPGLTGYWQIYAREFSSSVQEMWPYDRAYLIEASFRTDLLVIARTFRIVIQGKGVK